MRPGIKAIDASTVQTCMHQGHYRSPEVCTKEFGAFTSRYQCASCSSVLCADHKRTTNRPFLPPGGGGGKKNKEHIVCLLCFNLIERCQQELPLQLFHLSLVGCYTLTPIDEQNLKLTKKFPDYFLSADFPPFHSGDPRLSKVTQINMSLFCNVHFVGNNCLGDFRNLLHLDLSGVLCNVTSIGNLFVFNCPALRSVNLGALPKLTCVGSCFLSKNPALTSVDLSGFSSAFREVGKQFLEDCGKVKCDLSSLFHLLDASPELQERNFSTMWNWNFENELERQRRKRIIWMVNLVSYKSTSRIGKDLLSQEWAPRKLLLKLLLPIERFKLALELKEKKKKEANDESESSEKN